MKTPKCNRCGMGNQQNLKLRDGSFLCNSCTKRYDADHENDDAILGQDASSEDSEW